MANTDNKDLELNALNEVSGGRKIAPAPAVAADNGTAAGGQLPRCMTCNTKLVFIEVRRIDGGTTGIYKCMNKFCTEFGKEKNNLEVNW